MTPDELATCRYVSLTTYRRDGSHTAVPVWIAPLGGSAAGFTTERRSHKVTRIGNDPRVLVQPCDARGNVDLADLRAKAEAHRERLAALMITYPSTHGVFEERVKEICAIVHELGGQVYMDGANLNALAGLAKPALIGADVCHMNLHKTFSTPHGGGGPASGAVGVAERLLPFMPVPVVGKQEVGGEAVYHGLTEKDMPQTIGRLSGFMGNAGVLLRAYVYMRMVGRDGMRRIAEYATLNANYLQARLRDSGFELAFPGRRASHEFIVTLKREAKEYQLTAMDIAKALLDYSFHAPTTYFPLLVPECLLIEPTETEDKATLDNFVEAMIKIDEEARTDVNILKSAPVSLPVKRLDDVKAARELDLAWKPSA